MADVTVEQQREDNVVLAVVRGELDISTAPRLEEDLGDVASSRLVLDLSDLEFVDSTGLRTIVVVGKRASGGFAIVCPEENHVVQRMLDFFGIPSAWPVHGTREEAGLT